MDVRNCPKNARKCVTSLPRFARLGGAPDRYDSPSDLRLSARRPRARCRFVATGLARRSQRGKRERHVQPEVGRPLRRLSAEKYPCAQPWNREIVHEYLEKAIAVEFFTIPLYLTAGYSLHKSQQVMFGQTGYEDAVKVQANGRYVDTDSKKVRL